MIGIELNEARLTEELDRCLLTDEELAVPVAARAAAFDDPFTAWAKPAKQQQEREQEQQHAAAAGGSGVGGAHHHGHSH
eukprot:g5700.t1